MKGLHDALNLVEMVVLGALGVVATIRWRRRGGASRAWMAITFTVLGSVVIAGHFIPVHSGSAIVLWERKASIGILLLFPYCLFRFTTTFQAPPRWLGTSALCLTAVAAGAGFAFTHLPEPGDPRTRAVTAYLVLILVQWVSLSVLVARRLWRAGGGQPTISRRRMRTLSVGAAGMAAALVVAGVSPSSAKVTVAQILTQLMVLAVSPLFLLGFAPPRIVLASWRREAERELRDAERDLMQARTPAEVAALVLPHVTRILGGSGSVLSDADGAVLGAHGVDASRAEDLAQRALVVAEPLQSAQESSDSVLSLPVGGGRLSVEANAYTPYFGREEAEILQGLAMLVEVALERSTIAEREHQAATDLLQANETMREFVAIASHDLRTPITVIKGFAGLLEGRWEETSDADRSEYLSTISRQADRLARLVEDLLTVSRIDAGALEPDLHDVDLSAVLPRSVHERSADGTVIGVVIPPGLGARADPDHLDRIMANYLENAVIYGRTPISLEARAVGDFVEIRVRDSGDGVPETFVPRLFERFARADISKSKDKRGTGLGLSIVRGLAQAGGGDAWFEANQPSGACFGVRLPRAVSGR